MTPFFQANDLIPRLREAFRDRLPNPTKLLRVAVPLRGESVEKAVPAGTDRRRIAITSEGESWDWEVDSLQGLFRGNKQPPVLGDYPEAHNDTFALLDLRLLEISSVFGDRRDKEMEEIYPLLRRRPDGKGSGFVHDYLWQVCALILGTRPLSQAEYEAIIARIERTCRRMGQGSSARNMVPPIRGVYQQG